MTDAARKPLDQEPDESAATARRQLSLIQADEAAQAEDDFYLRVMVDSLVRAGHSEREVVAAVEQATGRRGFGSPRQRGDGLLGALRRFIG